VVRVVQAAEKKEGMFDLVLSDIGLPDGTGLQLMKALKQRWGLKVRAPCGSSDPTSFVLHTLT
jgi:CheY-like chemotaxis protein